MNESAIASSSPSDSNSQQQLIQLLKRLQISQQELQLSTPLAENLHFLENRITKFKVTVPLIGKFSSGKSSLLNAYLGKDYLRYDITPETAFATELTYAEQEQAIIYRTDGSEQILTLEAFKQLDDPDTVLYSQLKINNQTLKQHTNLVLVDMPGFDAQNQAHQNAIIRYLEKGDLFINLLPSNVPFDGSIMQQLAEIHYGYDKPITCLISKAGRCTQCELTAKREEVSQLLALHLEQDSEIGFVESMGPEQDLQSFCEALELAERSFDSLLLQRYSNSINDTILQTSTEISALLNFAATDYAELEQKIHRTSLEFEQAQESLDKHLNHLQHNLLGNGITQLRQQCHSALSRGSEQLILAAKSNSLSQAINSILRPTVQNGLQQLVQQEMSRLQTNLGALSSGEYAELDISLQLPEAQKEGLLSGLVDITITLSTLLLKGKLFFLAPIVSIIAKALGSEMQEQEREQQIRDQINSQVIPQAVASVEIQVCGQLKQIVTELSDACQLSFADKKTDFETCISQMKQELAESQDQHQQLTDKYKAHYRQVEQEIKLCELLSMIQATNEQPEAVL
ncbi:dynamin family protein [Shewanella mesophila]|uniref:dynamin family protein n=1 Tax=Shewanella mesophila TaxID=2864208 RepID=UPI001C65DD4D|nr:dynamin family protein [Shewanella mesophila]QYJ85854.1 dynamin family protein [Shewanella mesophila]